MEIIKSIQNRIHEIRGERVMPDKDLALLYETPTKFLNLAVKRNMKRFPEDFMFQLSKEESEFLRLQFATSKTTRSLDPTILNSAGRGGSRYLPYAFTEQGIAMLSGILNSDKAVDMNIAIMRAFVAIRKIVLGENNLKQQLKEIKEKIEAHDDQLNGIYDAIENVLDEKAAARKWEERERIGFRNNR